MVMRLHTFLAALLACSAPWLSQGVLIPDSETMQDHQEEQKGSSYLRRQLTIDDTSSSLTSDIQQIVNGQGAAIGQFPWYAELLAYPTDGNSLNVRRCGGAMISGDLVVTAANCLYDLNGFYANRFTSYAIIKRDQTVALGQGTVKTWKVMRPHPAHVYPNLTNNVAVIQLSGDNLFPQYDIGTIIGDTSQPPARFNLTGMGYGISPTQLAQTLQYANFSVIRQSVNCTIANNDEFFCLNTTRFGNRGPNFCNGDEGAPIVAGTYGYQSLYGLYTGTPSCTNVVTPPTNVTPNAIILRVSYHQTWILQTACNLGNARCAQSCSLLNGFAGFASNSIKAASGLLSGAWQFVAAGIRQVNAGQGDGETR